MTKMIQLTAIDSDRETSWLRQIGVNAAREADENSRDLDDDSDFTDDELDRAPARTAAPQPAPTRQVIADPATAPEGTYFPVMVNPEDLREFYPRRDGRTGTRLVYKNGSARPVRETFADVVAALAAI